MSFRGISVTIRKGINNNDLKGQLTPTSVRKVLDGVKASAPDQVIEKSLKYMAKNGDIVDKNGRFFTKEAAAAQVSAIQRPEVAITGKLVKSEMLAGKITATVEVTSLEYK